MGDNDTTLELQLRTTGLSDLKSGMSEASDVVDTSLKAMSSSFTEAGEAAKQFSLGGILAFHNMRAAVAEQYEEIAKLRAEIMETSDEAKRMELTSQLQAMERQMMVTRGEMRGFRYELMESRETAMMLGETIGVHLPASLVNAMAQLPAFRGAMEAAFPVIMVASFAMMIGKELANAYVKVFMNVEALKEAEKEYGEVSRENLKIEQQHLDILKQKREITLVGLDASSKAALSAINEKSALSDMNALQKQFLHQLQAQEDRVEELDGAWVTLKTTMAEDFGHGMKGYDQQQLEEARQKADALRSAIEELRQKIESASEAGVPKAGVEASEEAQKAMSKQLELGQKQSLALIDQAEALAKAKLEINHATIAETAASDTTFENDRAEVKRKNLLAQMQLETADKEHQDDLKAQLVELESNHAKKIIEIETKRVKDTQKLDDGLAEQQITIEQKRVEESSKVNEQQAARLYSAHKLNMDELTEVDRTAANDRFVADQKALEEQLKMAQRYPEENMKLIAELQEKEKALTLSHKAEMAKIDDDEAKRKQDLYETESAAKLAAAEDFANNMQNVAKEENATELALHKESNAQWLANEHAALNEWYRMESQALEERLAEAKKIYGDDIKAYENLIRQKEKLDQEYNRNAKKLDDDAAKEKLKKGMQVVSAYNSDITKMIMGEQSFGKTVKSIWETMTRQIISYLLQQLEEKYVVVYAEIALEKLLQLAGIGSTSANTQKKTAAQQDISIDAATTYGDVFAQAIQGIPFPDNLVAAPIMADVAAGALETQSYAMMSASAQYGGIVPASPTFMTLHKNEMVLPEHLSSFIQSAVSKKGGNSSSVGGVHFHYNGGDKASHADASKQFTKMFNNSVRRGTIGMKNL